MNESKHELAHLTGTIAHQITKEELMKLCDIWQETLKHFKINRPVLPFEHMKIIQIAKSYGYAAAAYALAGVRFEEKTQTFNPANHVSLARVQDPALFEKFLNLAARQKTLQSKA